LPTLHLPITDMQGAKTLNKNSFQNFLVIDTEGVEVLREIAVIDHQGKLIYEAFVDGHERNRSIHHGRKSLEQIIRELAIIIAHKTIICHYAEHDREVISRSFDQAQIPQPQVTFLCTCELAKKYLPHAQSYALDHLSKILNLQVNHQYFHDRHAHVARYDAQFTYQLYRQLQQLQAMSQLSTTPNPFSSSRVDNPFQDHLDFQEIYAAEFAALKSVLLDVKNDPNQQSKGALVIGEAGSGKTHLMMRLAKEFLRTNRLLFIRHPNNAQSVIYHTYSRILESFAERVPHGEQARDQVQGVEVKTPEHTQLELLLSNSLIKILSSRDKFISTQKGRDIIAALENNSLSLYKRLGADGTQRNRDNWQSIEKYINDWWTERYTGAGYSATILKGIIRFCSYTDSGKKELVRRWLAGHELDTEEATSIGLENWSEDLSREEFALEAIGVFGRLATLDEPLIIVFDQLESLGAEQNRDILNSFGSAVKEILTHVPNSLIILNLFPDRWQQFQSFFDGSVVDRVSQYTIKLNRPLETKLKNILNLKSQSIGLDIETLFTPLELGDILKQKSIRAVLNRAAEYYRSKANGQPLTPAIVNANPISEAITNTSNISNNIDFLTRFELLETTVKKIATLLLPFAQGEISTNFSNLSNFSPTLDSINPDLIGLNTPLPVTDPAPDIVAAYLSQTRQTLEEEYDQVTVIDDYDDIGKLKAIVNAFQQFQQIEVGQVRLGRIKIPENLLLTINHQEWTIAFLNLGGSAFTAKIKRFNECVHQLSSTNFHLIKDRRGKQISLGTVGQENINILNKAKNGKFIVFDRQKRINFELLYRLIIDIQEQDLEVNLSQALPIAARYLQDDWLVQILGKPLID
jgi:DNA polymerase III epsilon subunit-like protein